MAVSSTTFKKGKEGGPGRPKGFKSKALSLINEVYAGREDEVREYLIKLGIEDFLSKFVLPFLPKDLNITFPDGLDINHKADLSNLTDKELDKLESIRRKIG